MRIIKTLLALFFVLMVCMTGAATMAAASSKLPDLVPAVVNINDGLVEVRNAGEVAAKPSQVFVNCSRIFHGKTTPCGAGLQLPGYIEKWNVMAYDVPALQPGEHYLFHVFGSGAFPYRPGAYGMAITADALRHIAESSESNNDTRLDTVIEAGKSSSKYASGKLRNHATDAKEGVGLLHLRILMEGKPIPFEIGWTSPARGFLSDEYLFSSETGEAVTPLTGTYVQPMKLRAGAYDLKVRLRAVGSKDIVIKRVVIRNGETVAKTVDFHQPGVLNIMARWIHQPINVIACAEYYNPINPGRLGALMGGGSGAGGRSRGDCLDPNVYLAVLISSPGRSDGDVARLDGLKSKTNKNADGKIAVGENIEAIKIEAGVYDIAFWPVGHRELQQTLKGIEIASGETTEKKLEFRWPEKKK